MSGSGTHLRSKNDRGQGMKIVSASQEDHKNAPPPILHPLQHVASAWPRPREWPAQRHAKAVVESCVDESGYLQGMMLTVKRVRVRVQLPRPVSFSARTGSHSWGTHIVGSIIGISCIT